MEDFAIKKMIKEHEGFRDTVYKDHLGNLTIGYGHFLGEGSRLPHSILDAIFEYDYLIASEGYDTLKLDLDPVRRGVLIDLIFNMGLPRLKKFKLMLAALERKDYIRAAEELQHSTYFKQVPIRAEELRKKLLNG